MKSILNKTKNAGVAFILASIVGGGTAYAQDQYGDDGYGNNNENYDQSGNYADPNAYNGNDYGQQEPTVTYNDFYSTLAPYGNWVNYGSYGRVWVCNIPGFRPYYSAGHWVNTNFGWSWASDYNWGWAPFHYGRWGFAANIGWYWVPGYTWGPAWVSWGASAGMYGWAPLGPGLDINVSIGMIPAFNWVFMPSRYMGMPNIYRYYAPYRNNVTIIRRTTIINNYNSFHNVRYAYGPRVADVQRFTGRPVNMVRVVRTSDMRSNGRISNGNMMVYNPGRGHAAAGNGNRMTNNPNAGNNNRYMGGRNNPNTFNGSNGNQNGRNNSGSNNGNRGFNGTVPNYNRMPNNNSGRTVNSSRLTTDNINRRDNLNNTTNNNFWGNRSRVENANNSRANMEHYVDNHVFQQNNNPFRNNATFQSRGSSSNNGQRGFSSQPQRVSGFSRGSSTPSKASSGAVRSAGSAVRHR